MLLTVELSRRMASVVKSVHKDECVLVSRRLCLEHRSFAMHYGLNMFVPPPHIPILES